MAKITLNVEPTFTAPVQIPIPGAGLCDPVKFTFKFRKRDEFKAFLEEVSKQDGKEKTIDDVAFVKSMVEGWELEDAFTDENIHRICQKYQSAPEAIYMTYLYELTGIKTRS